MSYLVRLFTCMQSHVGFKVLWMSEPLSARLTSEISAIGVNHFVPLSNVAIDKAFPTKIALIRFFSVAQVLQLVFSQVLVSIGGKIALIASKFLHQSLDSVHQLYVSL